MTGHSESQVVLRSVKESTLIRNHIDRCRNQIRHEWTRWKASNIIYIRFHITLAILFHWIMAFIEQTLRSAIVICKSNWNYSFWGINIKNSENRGDFGGLKVMERALERRQDKTVPTSFLIELLRHVLVNIFEFKKFP